MLRKYCQKAEINCPAVSTIGKIISRNHIFFDKPTYGYHDPNRKRYRRKKIRAKYAPHPRSGGYVQLDTIETRIGAIRRYTITAIDIDNKCIWEFKCVNELQIEHLLQLVIYSYINVWVPVVQM